MWCRHLACTGAGWKLAPPARLLPPLLTLLAALHLSGCSLLVPHRTISLETLEAAPAVPVVATASTVVADPDALRDLCVPLGRRLAFVQVRSDAAWQKLRAAAPELSLPVDFRGGTVIGLASWSGTPIDGRWPLRLHDVRTCAGVGLAAFDCAGGSYLPDGVAYLQVAFVRDPAAILVVDVNGLRYYPADLGAD